MKSKLFNILVHITCFFVALSTVAGCGESKVVHESSPTPARIALISGTVFRDENADGVYSANLDIPISGAFVTAYLGSEPVTRVRTDNKGQYTLSAAAGTGYTIRTSFVSPRECYDPETKEWGYLSTIAGEVSGVQFPSKSVDIGIEYRMLNYGPQDFSWELWHEGPVFTLPNVILVHGAHVSIIPLILKLGGGKVKGEPDYEFRNLGQLLQSREHGQYNGWEFEYADAESFGRYWTHGSISDYGNRLGSAIDLIESLTKESISIVSHSMGGLVSRYAAQYVGGVDRILTLATGHFGFEYTWLSTSLLDFPCIREMEPGSEFLLELNSDFKHGDFQLASIAAVKDEPRVAVLEGIVRYSSASMVQCQGNGNVTYDMDNSYFTIVEGTHGSIKEIDLRQEDDNKSDDFVFKGIKLFLEEGISDRLKLWSEFMYPADYDTRPYFSFRFTTPTPEGYPKIWVEGKRVYSFDMYATDSNRMVWNFRAGVSEEGNVTIDYAGKGLESGWLTRGQSTIMTRTINN